MSKALVAAMMAAILSLVLACGPAAPTESTGDAAADQMASRFTPITAPPTNAPEEPRTLEGWPTEEPTGEPGIEEAPPAPGTTPGPKPEPEPKPIDGPEQEGDEPTPDQEPDPTPGFQPGPTRIPDPQHVDGFESCQRVAMFRDHASLQYQDWCNDTLIEHIASTCASEPDADAQRRCGEEAVQDFDGMLYRLGPARCLGIDDGDVRNACIFETMEDAAAVSQTMYSAWEQIRAAANQDPEVQRTLDATISCLDGAGFAGVDHGILFHWQHLLLPAEAAAREDRLTDVDKDLRERIREPSRTCARQEGLFAAQDAAWLAELRHRQEAEPQAVAALIREGFLEALERPGEPSFITGDPPPHETPQNNQEQ